MSNNFEMMGLFAVPILKIKFKDHYKYTFPEVEKKDRIPKGWKLPINTTFPTIPDDDSIVPSKVRDSLMKDMKDGIVDVFEQLNLPTNIGYRDFWYNIYHDYQGQEKHNHLSVAGYPVTFWSGIYYNKNTSPTQFYRNNSIVNIQRFEGCEETAMAPYLADGYNIPIEDGDILLFPPYLEHGVQPKDEHQDKMRMTFSFNITLI